MAQGMRLAVESLEHRQLLSMFAPDPVNGVLQPPYARFVNRSHGIPASDRRIVYTTADGAVATITLFGYGSLAGTTVGPDGALNLVYGGTGVESNIIGKVRGGNGHATLASILPANAPSDTLTGLGATPIYKVDLHSFNLEPGGVVNLTAGIQTLALNSVAANTQLHLRQLSPSLTEAMGGTQTVNEDGVNLTYTATAAGAETLTGLSGQFTTGPNLMASTVASDGLPVIGGPPAPPGMQVLVSLVHGTPVSTDLQDPEVFGYDPTAHALIRFDARNGAPVQSIPVPNLTAATAGVALALDGGEQVVLVGGGTTVDAFDVVTGALVGQFSTAGLAAEGFGTVSGIGTADTVTVLADAPDNLLQAINVAASLATGQAVPLGSVYQPVRQFTLNGGLTGVPGSNVFFAAGAAHFDTFQPDQTQAGVLELTFTHGQLGEVARVPFKANGIDVNVTPGPGALGDSLGAVDQSLALLGGVTNGANVVNLYSQSLAQVGTVTLDDPNALTGLSETVRPGLAGAALFDVQGNIQSFRVLKASGMVLNDLGNLNRLQIVTTANTTIAAFPFTHAAMPHRTNVTILTPLRVVGDRNGVTIVPGLLPIGPLLLP